MRQNLLRVESGSWVGDQQTSDEVLGALGDVVPEGRGEFVLAPLNHLEQLRVVLLEKGRETAEHDVEDNPNAPIVHFTTVSLAHQDLRGHVARGSTGSSCQLSLDKSSQTEVRNFDDRGLILRSV